MSENKKQQETVQKQPESATPVAAEKYTFAYCMEQIERIAASQNDGFYAQALAHLKELSSAGPGDIAGAEKAKAISDAIKCRETTNQQLLAFYEKMAAELKPTPSSQQTILEGIERMLCNPEIPEGLKQTLAAELMTAL